MEDTAQASGSKDEGKVEEKKVNGEDGGKVEKTEISGEVEKIVLETTRMRWSHKED